MSSTACGLCGPVHGHHITRRPGRHEPYFDPDLRLWLCSRPSLNHHARAHELLRAIGLDLLPPGADPLAYRLQLLEVHARWAGDNGAAFALADAPASHALAELVAEARSAVSARSLGGVASWL